MNADRNNGLKPGMQSHQSIAKDCLDEYQSSYENIMNAKASIEQLFKEAKACIEKAESLALELNQCPEELNQYVSDSDVEDDVRQSYVPSIFRGATKVKKKHKVNNEDGGGAIKVEKKQSVNNEDNGGAIKAEKKQSVNNEDNGGAIKVEKKQSVNNEDVGGTIKVEKKQSVGNEDILRIYLPQYFDL